MGNPLVPNILRTGKLLTPQMANETFRRLLEQQMQAAGRRFIFDEIVIPFKSGATQATAAEQIQAYVNAPRAYTIIGRELYVYGDDGETFSLGVDNMDNLSVVAAGSGSLAVARDLPAQRQSGYVNAAITSSATTWTLTAGWCVLHVAYDRFEGQPPESSVDRLLGDETMLAARSVVNANITTLENSNTTLAAAERQQRVDVLMFGDTDFTSIPTVARDMPVPLAGGTIGRMEIEIVADATRTVQIELLDDGLAVVATVSVTGSGSTSLIGDNTDPAAALANNNCDPTKDYFLRWSLSGSGTVYTAYAVLSWT